MNATRRKNTPTKAIASSGDLRVEVTFDNATLDRCETVSVPPNGSVQRPATEALARGRAGLVRAQRLLARGQSLYRPWTAATAS